MPEIKKYADAQQARALIEEALQDRVLTVNEADTILSTLRQNGISKIQVNEIVEALTYALGHGHSAIDLETNERRAVLDRFFNTLNLFIGSNYLSPKPKKGFLHIELIISRKIGGMTRK